MHRNFIEKGARVIDTKHVSLYKNVYFVMKSNQQVTFMNIIGSFDDAHTNVESHIGDATSAADMLHFRPAMNENCDQHEPSLVLAEGNNVTTDENMDAMASKDNAEVLTRQYPQGKGNYPERFTINSLVLIQDDDDVAMRES